MSKRFVCKGIISVHAQHSVVDSTRKGQSVIVVEDGKVKGKIVADPDNSAGENGRGEGSPEAGEISLRVHKKIIGSIDRDDVEIPCLFDEKPQADAV